MSWDVAWDSFSALDTSVLPISQKGSIIHDCASRMSLLQQASIKYLPEIISCSHWGLPVPLERLFSATACTGNPNVNPVTVAALGNMFGWSHNTVNAKSAGIESLLYLMCAHCIYFSRPFFSRCIFFSSHQLSCYLKAQRVLRSPADEMKVRMEEQVDGEVEC